MKKKVTAISVQLQSPYPGILFERDYDVNNCKVYWPTVSSMKRAYNVLDRLPWQNAKIVLLGNGFIAEDANRPEK